MKIRKGDHIIKFLKPVDISFLIIFTLLFAYDFFPNTLFEVLIPKEILITLAAGLYLFSLFLKRKKDVDNKKILKWQIFSTFYILFLMRLFILLGGKSSSGISFDNGFLWVVILISIFETFSQWKKVKRTDV